MIRCLMYRNDVTEPLRAAFGDAIHLQTVQTVGELVAAAEHTPVDLVCWDTSLPDAENPEQTMLLRANPRVCGAAFIYIGLRSALTPKRECQLLESGLEDVICLPTDPAILRTRVQAALHRRQLLQDVSGSRWLQYVEQTQADAAEILLFAYEVDLYHGALVRQRATPLAVEGFLPLSDYFGKAKSTASLRLVHPDDLQTVRAALNPEYLRKMAFAGKPQAWQVEYRMQDKHERWVWVRHTVNTQPDSHVGVQCFSAIALREPRATEADIYHKILGTDVVMAAVLDLEQDVLKQIYTSLPVAGTGMPRSYRDNYRHFFTQVLTGDEQDRAIALFAPDAVRCALEKDGTLHHQFQARLPGRGPCRLGIEILRYDANPNHLTFVVRDITRLFQQQQEREQVRLAANATREHLDTIMRINPNAMSTFRIDLTADLLTDGFGAYPNLQILQARGTVSGYVRDALPNFSYKNERREFAQRFSIEKLIEEYEAGHPQVSMRHHYMISDLEERILVTIVSMMKNKLTGHIEGIVYTLDETKEWYAETITQALFSQVRIGAIIINVKNSTFIVPQQSPLLPFAPSYREQDYRAGTQAVAAKLVAPDEQEAFLREAEIANLQQKLDAQGYYGFTAVWHYGQNPVTVRLRCYYLDDTHEQIICMAEDVTEVTRRERQQVEQYRQALQTANQATQEKNLMLAAAQTMFPMCMVVNLTQNTYKVVEYEQFYNRRAAPQGDYDELVRLGQTVLPEQDRAAFAAAFNRQALLDAYAKGEKTVSLTHGQYGDDGTLHRNRTTAIFARDEYTGDVLEISVIDCLDEQVRTEQLLKERERQLQKALAEAEKANHAKSDFLSSMSHDIRTPLNAIINLTGMLSEELDNPAAMKADIEKIEVAGEFLLQLINDILDISKIESGKLTLNPRVYTYNTFLSYVKGIIVPLCRDKDITFELDEGPTALDIYMDRVRFHQVFFNILSNAVKYTPPGGTVRFATTNNVVHDGILTCDFIVSDTGMGMSQAFLEHAFDPFVREDDKNAYVGTGLGLTICKRLVDLMGGTIKIESELGKGTTVTVHMDLPLATDAQRQESAAELNTAYHNEAPTAPAGEQRILVAEDNVVNREILTRLLQKRDYLVEAAENGKRALELYHAHPAGYYQLILMDVRMPVMDGLQATAAIRSDADEEKRHIPIIATTANAFEGDVQECLQAGMNAHIAKPINPNELYEMIATYLRLD